MIALGGLSRPHVTVSEPTCRDCQAVAFAWQVAKLEEQLSKLLQGTPTATTTSGASPLSPPASQHSASLGQRRRSAFELVTNRTIYSLAHTTTPFTCHAVSNHGAIMAPPWSRKVWQKWGSQARSHFLMCGKS